MTPSEPEEAELQELFDRTSEQATGPLLTRLRALSSEVPERAARRPRLLPRWAWAPTLAGLCAGLGALSAALLGGGAPQALPSASPGPQLLALSSTPSQASALAASSAVKGARSSAPAADDSASDDQDDELDDWGEGDDEAWSYDLSIAHVPDA
ncbi:MAG TPA: hypothetical protein VGP93_20470, partial [Polyangiaceae bacterium]|nr:hypothetical protein [Polyangiaceae bacterium]